MSKIVHVQRKNIIYVCIVYIYVNIEHRTNIVCICIYCINVNIEHRTNIAYMYIVYIVQLSTYHI